jgi:hypothetical protein
MAEMHPEDVELLELVEGDLPAERRSAVSAHVAKCAGCAESVRVLEAGKTALREAARLELAPDRREAIVAGLPPRPARRRRFRAGRAVAVLAPVAAIVALAVTLASLDLDLDGGGDAEEAAAPAGREQAATAEAEGAEDASRTSPSTLSSVAGPAAAVAEFLRDRGFDARVVGDHVEVRDADPRAVGRALAGRRSGAVRVVVR